MRARKEPKNEKICSSVCVRKCVDKKRSLGANTNEYVIFFDRVQVQCT